MSDEMTALVDAVRVRVGPIEYDTKTAEAARTALLAYGAKLARENAALQEALDKERERTEQRDEMDVKAEWLRLDAILSRALGRCDGVEVEYGSSEEALNDVECGIVDARRELWTFCKKLLAGRGEAPVESNEERQLAEIARAIGTVEFMDPPDGGSPSLAEQVQRMRAALGYARWEIANSAEHQRSELVALTAELEAANQYIKILQKK